MNKEQISRLDCLNLIVYEAEQHKDIVTTVSVFETNIQVVKDICVQVNALKPLQETDSKGVTNKRDHVKDELTELLGDLSGALQVHAYEQKDQIMLEKVKSSVTSLGGLKKTELISRASIIIGEAEKLTVDQLAAHGFTAEELALTKTLHQTFTNEVQAPRKVIIDRSSYTANIERLINKAWTIKRKILDKLVTQFKRKDPDFYMKYKAASHVSYYRSHSNGTNGQGEIGEKDESGK